MTGTGRRGRRLIVAAAACAALLTGPAISLASAHAPSSHRAARAHLTEFRVGTASPTCDVYASLKPTGPAVVAPGSFVETIKKRGYLIAGVDLSDYGFGFLNPVTKQVEGFDIDILHAISFAIFGDNRPIHYVSVSNVERSPAIQHGTVDIVAHTMTITCARLKLTDFSTVYFNAEQRTLVDSNSRLTSLADIGTGKVCAPAESSPIQYLRNPTKYHHKKYNVVPVTNSTDCLVLLQEGKVEAISTDDAILAGLKAQDPETKILPQPLSSAPYGLAISLTHPDFVRFVNAVLDKMRADGDWAAIYKKWIGGTVPPPPPAKYRD